MLCYIGVHETILCYAHLDNIVIYLSIYLSTYYLSICLSICLSIYVPIVFMQNCLFSVCETWMLNVYVYIHIHVYPHVQYGLS